jgi:hypothetical protein
LKENRCRKVWEEPAFVVHLAVTMPAPWSGFVLKFGSFVTRLEPIRFGATKGSQQSGRQIEFRTSKKAETVSDVSVVRLINNGSQSGTVYTVDPEGARHEGVWETEV